MWNILKVIIFLVIMIIIATFAVQNQGMVSLNWYFNLTGIEVPLYILLYGSIVGGILLGLAVGGTQRLSLWKKNRQLSQNLKKLTAETMDLKKDYQYIPSRASDTEDVDGRI
ncbi:MAG: LapA family protein [Syntrophales bacterium]|nr:LapA family protein [Syntrophales bacterium]